MKNKIKSVSVCIPAHNEEDNIHGLISQILSQNQDSYVLKEIIVYSDASTDQTENIVNHFDDSRIKLISGKINIGQLQGIRKMLELSKGDVVVLFDADIKLNDSNTLENIVAPFYKDSKIGLVAGKRKAVKGKTFVEKAIQSSVNVYDNIAKDLRNGSNPYNCHGCSLALSSEFAHKIELPKEIFSGDTYMYFYCLWAGYKFHFAEDSVVLYMSANNLKDAISQYRRFVGIDPLSVKKFGDLLDKEYIFPQSLRIKYSIQEFLHMPIHTLFMFGLIKYCKFTKSKIHFKNGIWEVAKSTKRKI